ncbi:MAG: AGE family epimerase/isomerase [Solobacterium sp.]|nr:AGE family epimerase/isomerase [Solobacterium sp.]
MNKKYQLDTEENRIWLKELREELLDFGRKFPSPEGLSYYLGSDGEPIRERPRELWITCRMAHVYSLGEALEYPRCKELVDTAIHGIRKVLHDDQNGGYYPGIYSDLTPMAQKQCYGHAFVILAAGSAMAMGHTEAEALFRESTKIFLDKFWDEEKGLTRDTYNTEFTVLEPYRGLNANMHTVEAFLAAADVTGEEIWRERAGRIIIHVLKWAEENDWRIPEHFDEHWNPLPDYNKDKPDDPFKPYGATPGHGIEWSRLITQWALSSGKDETYIKKACALYDRAVSDGWNADGNRGIVYTTDWQGRPVVHDRMHRTLAEAINTSAVLYHVTGDTKYQAQYAEYMQYLNECVHDPVYGSWYHQLDEKNQLKETVWPGKSDLYHALQSTLIPLLVPSVSVLPAVKKRLYLEDIKDE